MMSIKCISSPEARWQRALFRQLCSWGQQVSEMAKIKRRNETQVNQINLKPVSALGDGLAQGWKIDSNGCLLLMARRWLTIHQMLPWTLILSQKLLDFTNSLI